MERTSTYSVPEIVGIAAAAAAALGGVIVALGRSQAHAAHASQVDAEATHPFGMPELSPQPLRRGREAASAVVSRLAAAYPDLRGEASAIVAQVGDARSETVGSVIERVHEAIVPGIAGVLDTARKGASDALSEAEPTAASALASTAAAAERAVERTTSAGKEFFATLSWLIAASAIVYVALLSPRRREHLKSALCATFDALRSLSRDFQGYDEGL